MVPQPSAVNRIMRSWLPLSAASTNPPSHAFHDGPSTNVPPAVAMVGQPEDHVARIASGMRRFHPGDRGPQVLLEVMHPAPGKTSPIDAVAVKHWEDYSDARDEMLARTHTMVAPWTVVRTDDKRMARINLIRDLLTRLDFKGKDRKANLPDPDVVFTFSENAISDGLLAK